jgi:putative DNA primase/helicase
LLPVLNGLLDLETRKLSPHSADFLSAVQIPVKFDADARCPAWDKFISEVFPSDSEAIAWEIVAWLMTPDTSIQKAILLLGDGANGKSTYLRGVIAFIGKRNTTNVSLQKLENDRFSVARLIGRLANICPDLPSTDLTSTSVFKAITGGNPLMAEYKFKDSFEFVPFSRLVFSANHPPKSQDASPAFFRRWIVVPFERTFVDGAPETIPSDKLDAILSDPAELSGVLNKALDAIAAIRTQGLSVSDSSQCAADEFRKATDPLAVWLDRKTILHSQAVIPKDVLYREYSRSCTDSGRPLISKTAFGLAIKKLRPTVTDFQRTVNGVLAWCYVGISLLTNEG